MYQGYLLTINITTVNVNIFLKVQKKLSSSLWSKFFSSTGQNSVYPIVWKKCMELVVCKDIFNKWLIYSWDRKLVELLVLKLSRLETCLKFTQIRTGPKFTQIRTCLKFTQIRTCLKFIQIRIYLKFTQIRTVLDLLKLEFVLNLLKLS
jgi:hypothetical protein